MLYTIEYIKIVLDKWFINLSSHNIPENVISLLQLDENFSLPISKKSNLYEIIKDVENNLKFLDKKTAESIRSHFISKLSDFLFSTTDKQILRNLSRVKTTFRKKYPKILFIHVNG